MKHTDFFHMGSVDQLVSTKSSSGPIVLRLGEIFTLKDFHIRIMYNHCNVEKVLNNAGNKKVASSVSFKILYYITQWCMNA